MSNLKKKIAFRGSISWKSTWRRQTGASGRKKGRDHSRRKGAKAGVKNLLKDYNTDPIALSLRSKEIGGKDKTCLKGKGEKNSPEREKDRPWGKWKFGGSTGNGFSYRKNPDAEPEKKNDWKDGTERTEWGGRTPFFDEDLALSMTAPERSEKQVRGEGCK